MRTELKCDSARNLGFGFVTYLSSGSSGWYPDPARRFDSRFWDGVQWTTAVMRDGAVEADTQEIRTDSNIDATDPGSRIDGPIPIPPGPSDRFTSLSPVEAQALVHQVLLVTPGATTRSVLAGQIYATLSAKQEPNWPVVVLLCFFGIWPGILYWYLNSRPIAHAVTLWFLPDQKGTRVAAQGNLPALVSVNPVLARLPW